LEQDGRQTRATGGQGPFDTPPGEDPRPVDELLDLAFSAAGVAVETAGRAPGRHQLAR